MNREHWLIRVAPLVAAWTLITERFGLDDTVLVAGGLSGAVIALGTHRALGLLRARRCSRCDHHR
ncbi:hypothetical protein [Saccharothrix violaceirubra]|uniref:Prolyl-tRNA editing enzyme YbaK/EbsC (Cys-tRNA(Pro) deacylase) n=1 Tax=Saccharothrix violaceirubra TaxID=413306 RepID=A0A7W7WU06_9PSEU|nr:hypothetical protein [Saccharothrix violaceirubra]MBB4963257.1 prolyl-tRNA editing enzyme YbaK/EbsC (Cys-tRNA(Pro) deacylase) [Saccharothrix violaceirubra]